MFLEQRSRFDFFTMRIRRLNGRSEWNDSNGANISTVGSMWVFWELYVSAAWILAVKAATRF
jgi:hypothetical protein